MKKIWLSLVVAGLFFVGGMFAIVACSGDDDDDSAGDDDTWDEFTVTFSGTMNYDGDQTGARIMIALNNEIAGTPLWFGYVDIPADGFPFDYKIGVDPPFVGEYYVLALIDVDPTDGYMPNFDLDPLDIPETKMNVVEGDNQIDFTFVDPDVDDDDDSVDDDTTGDTGIYGTLSYDGTAGGTTVVFGFYDGLPMGPPDQSAEVEVPEANGFPFDYKIETDFTGDWHVVAFLDVNPNDGSSWNSELDPSNWALQLPVTTIVEGQLTHLDITLLDP